MGRPKEFNREEVLERAFSVFIQKGYESASVQDLVAATGVNRFSLYEAFGDKHGLFSAVLDHYHGRRRAQVAELLGRPGPKLPRFREYFQIIFDEAIAHKPSGCLITNATIEVARHDEATAQRAQEHFSRLEEMFVTALSEAQANGEFAPRTDLRALARFLLNSARGLRVLVAYTRDAGVARDIIATTFSIFDDDPANLTTIPATG